MSNKLTYQLSELNYKLLNTVFLFKEGSKLRTFLLNKEAIDKDKKYLTLAVIMLALKKIIKDEKLYDENNTTIILCSQELEDAINRKAMHSSEVRNEVVKQLLIASKQPSLRNILLGQNWIQRQEEWHPIWNTLHLERIEASHNTILQLTDELNIVNSVPVHNKFTPMPDFLKVLHLTPGVDRKQTTFTFSEVIRHLSSYILSKRDEIFDKRDIKIAIVKDDLLGIAFGVKAFHRNQVLSLMIKHLIPVNQDNPAR